MHILTPTGRIQHFGRPIPTVFIAALLLGLFYAVAVAYLERYLPIPSALQVGIGVLLTLLPVAVVARHEARFAGLHWRIYERMVLVACLGAGIPSCICQLVALSVYAI